eukprot:2608937-Lingulodinium_polyedra.AAC.1
MVQKYWGGCKRAILGATSLHLACDASRVGGKNVAIIALLGAATGVACWSAPGCWPKFGGFTPIF